MAVETTQFRFLGDKDKARELKGIALSGVSVLKNLMSYNKLDQCSIQKKMDDGSVVVINSCFGTTTANIFSPPKIEAEREAKPEVERLIFPVLVYIGPNEDFSEYGMEDLIEKTIHYWGVIPEYTLEKLYEKLLLVLICPIRVLTDTEVSMVKAFLKGSRKLVIFSGDDTVVANDILRQLESKLEVISYSGYTGLVYNLSGYITPKELVWWIGEPVGWIGVQEDYWSTATVRDWKGYGVLYNDITVLSPFCETSEWEENANTNIVNWIGDYNHSNDLVAKINAYNPDTDPTWTITFSTIGLPHYPVGYFPFSYTPSIDLTTWGSWMSANSSNLPLYRLRLHGHVPEKTLGDGGYYLNYSDTEYRGWSGANLAYVTGENIIVGSFKPSWLTVNYDPEDIDNWYKTKELSSWFLNSKLDYVDLFDQGGYSPVMPTSFYCQRGSDGSGQIIQY